MSVAIPSARHIGLCIIPKPENDYHPLALRHGPLAFVSALLIAVKVLTVGVIALTPSTAELSTITIARIVQLTNAERKKAGLNELGINASLAKAAQMKGEDMLKNDYFAHISPTGVTPWFWINKVGYSYQVAGENLAIDFNEAEDVVAAWMASPTHKENMLLPSYTETGVAVVTGEFQGGTSTIVVHMFGLPEKAPAAPQSTPEPRVEAQASFTAPATSPSPTATPSSPTQTPIPAPRTPRIALNNTSTNVRNFLKLQVASDPGTTVHIMVNNKESGTVQMTNGESTQEISLSNFPDGKLAIRAFATNPNTKLKSESSGFLTVTKDTTAPALERSAVMAVLTADTDTPSVYIHFNASSSERVVLNNGKTTQEIAGNERVKVPVVGDTSLSIHLKDQAGNNGAAQDIAVTPRFSNDQNSDFVSSPAQLSKTARWLTAIVFLIIFTLLMLAIFIRISIQRPALIAHATAVLVLAAVLLVW